MIYDTDLQRTFDWFCEAYRGRPSTSKNVHTQIGVHFEEIAEMLECFGSRDDQTKKLIRDAYDAIYLLAEHLKKEDNKLTITDRVEFLDSLCDQIVTAVGIGYHTRMAIVDAFEEVNRSNFSKFDDNGRAVLDENLKVAKSINYRRADLTPFV